MEIGHCPRIFCPRILSVICVVCGLLSCSRGDTPPRPPAAPHKPAAVATTPATPVHSGAAGAEHGSWATAGDSIPETLRAPCANVNSLVRSVVGAVPATTKITELSGPRPITFQYQYA